MNGVTRKQRCVYILLTHSQSPDPGVIPRSGVDHSGVESPPTFVPKNKLALHRIKKTKKKNPKHTHKLRKVDLLTRLKKEKKNNSS